ncbi:cytochrome C biogenesis protein CcdA [Neisseria arctica]|uniref:D-amino-acid oxidase n=1 Tax=Neisseria arctica TaxID=1470200 RepID=A0A0J0YPU1_9NEIS|nr:FAD-dependent oxidoreductase [Neisseria arctica]KLT72145.1 cytochrome C biogenesis protein CcdA [Neisseria arctica]UOO86835.1 FAD-binding oxidoreductase [Neisseria arctica]
MPTTAILGGGLCGRLLAIRLAEQGIQTALFEQGSRNGENAAAYIAAAMLAPAAESVEATPEVIALGYQSLPIWRAIIERLDTPVFMQQNGSLIVWHSQDKPLARQFEQHLHRAGTGLQYWQAADIAAAEPQLRGRFQAGFYLPEEGQLDNRQILAALANQAEQLGVQCHWHRTTDIETLQKQFACVIDCRGIGAKSSWNRPSENGSRLRGVRGEVARVYAPEVSLNRPVRLLHPRYPLYIAPKQNNVFVIGATQIESESEAPASVRSGLELLSALYAVHPAFGEAQILEFAAKLRPTLNHHNPEIRYRTDRSLVEINGLFRHGFMIAPAVTAAAARLIGALQHQQNIPEQDSESGLLYIPIRNRNNP